MRLFLQRQNFPVPKYTLYKDNVEEFLDQLPKFSGPVALDLETSGLDPFSEDAYIRSISLSNTTDHCIAADLNSFSKDQLDKLWAWVKNYNPGFLIHNAVFDKSWLEIHGKGCNVYRCTSVMFRITSNEGYAGQRWRLDDAILEVLGWDELNNIELNAALDKHKLSKGDMHKLDWEDLGKYSALDAGATYQLYDYIVNRLSKSPFNSAVTSYLDNEIASMIQVIVEQYIHGIYLDLEALEQANKELTQECVDLGEEFIQQSGVKEAIEDYNKEYVDKRRFNKHKPLTASGEPSKNWLKHEEKIKKLEETNHFNIDSPLQIGWLFYEKLKKPVVRWTKHKIKAKRKPSTDKDTLPLLGKESKPLLKYRKSRDIKKFITILNNVRKDFVIHPFLTISGAVTGRLTGGLQEASADGKKGKSVNMQNIVKDVRVQGAMIAPKGYKIIYMDFSSLEPHVLCEFSQDERLRELYLNNSAHDIYLWFGANTTFFGPTVRPKYPENIQKAQVKEAKNLFKDLRPALKIAVLGLGYMMGARSLMRDINSLTDLVMSYKEAQLTFFEYKKFFPGVERFVKKLDILFTENDERYILNGRGRPLFTNVDNKRLLCNKFVQSTGHDITQLLIHFILQERNKRGFHLIPYDVDKHDSTAWIFKEGQEEEAIDIYKTALNKLNDLVGWEVKFKGDIKIEDNLGAFLD